MSDIMLNAVIQMPYEMAMKDELSRRQFYERANQALNERNSKEAEIERLRMALTELANAVGGLSPGDEPDVYADSDELHRLLSQASAALSGEPT